MNRLTLASIVRSGLLGLVLVFGLCGCNNFSDAEVPFLGQTLATNPAELQPDALPYERAQILIEGTAIPVDVERSEGHEQVAFLFRLGESTIEEEHYAILPHKFALISTAENRFEPPLPLIKYPLHDQQEWTWSGEVLSGIATPAEAHLTARSESLHLDGGIHPAIRITVALEMQSPGESVVTRELNFWFSPGQGLIQRSFGTSSKRQPLPASLANGD